MLRAQKTQHTSNNITEIIALLTYSTQLGYILDIIVQLNTGVGESTGILTYAACIYKYR